jgi:small subunit ribosomal protein S9
MEATKSEKYIEAVGRRKTAVARVRLVPGSKNSFTINEDKNLESYFPTKEMHLIATSAITLAGTQTYKVSAHIIGGGIHAQAEALRHAIARALIKDDSHLRTTLKKAGMLKRDPRAKERRKFGLKKARKAPQWSKR